MSEDYTTPGYTLAQLETLIDNRTNLSVGTADELTEIDHAITAAGQAASTWEGRKWSWLEDTGLFQTHTKTVATVANSGATRASNVSTITTTADHLLAVNQTVKLIGVSDTTFNGTWTVTDATSDTAFKFSQVGDAVGNTTAGTGTMSVMSYPVRTIDVAGDAQGTAAHPEILSLEKVYFDDTWILQPISWSLMRRRMRILETTGNSDPFEYCIHKSLIYFWPVPSSAKNIWLDFVQRHSKITKAASTNAALIVPAEYQYQIYVEGAVWLLKNRLVSPESLRNCSPFMEAIGRMEASEEKTYDPANPVNMFLDATTGRLPHDRKILHTDGTLLIGDIVSL